VRTCKICKHYREPLVDTAPWYMHPHGRCTWGALKRKVPLWWHTNDRIRDPDREHQCQAWEERQ
jgi:hypothetical protein